MDPLGPRALPGRGRTMGSRRVVPVPLGLALAQRVRVGGERGQRPLDRRAPKQLLAALQLSAELLFGFREPRQRLARRFRAERRGPRLDLAEPLPELGRPAALTPTPHLAHPHWRSPDANAPAP